MTFRQQLRSSSNIYTRSATCIFDNWMLLDVVASFEHDKPDEKSSWDERSNTRDELERPWERQSIVVWLTTRQPEVFALQTKCIVGKHCRSRHQEHAYNTYWLITTFYYPNVTIRYVRVFAFTNPSVEIFGNVSMPSCTLAICWPPCKILQRSSQGNPYVGVETQEGYPNVATLDMSKARSRKWCKIRPRVQ